MQRDETPMDSSPAPPPPAETPPTHLVAPAPEPNSTPSAPQNTPMSLVLANAPLAKVIASRHGLHHEDIEREIEASARSKTVMDPLSSGESHYSTGSMQEVDDFETRIEIYLDSITTAGFYTIELDNMINEPELTLVQARKQLPVIAQVIEQLMNPPPGVDKNKILLARANTLKLRANQGEIEAKFPLMAPVLHPTPSTLPIGSPEQTHEEPTPSTSGQVGPGDGESTARSPNDERADEAQRLQQEWLERERLERQWQEQQRRKKELEDLAARAARDHLRLERAENEIDRIQRDRSDMVKHVEMEYGLNLDQFRDEFVRPAIQKARREQNNEMRNAQDTPKSILNMPAVPQKACLFCTEKNPGFLCYDPRFNTLPQRQREYQARRLCTKCATCHATTSCLQKVSACCKWFDCLSVEHHSNLCPNAPYPIYKEHMEAWYNKLRQRKDALKRIRF